MQPLAIAFLSGLALGLVLGVTLAWYVFRPFIRWLRRDRDQQAKMADLLLDKAVAEKEKRLGSAGRLGW